MAPTRACQKGGLLPNLTNKWAVDPRIGIREQSSVIALIVQGKHNFIVIKFEACSVGEHRRGRKASHDQQILKGGTVRAKRRLKL
jgi:hypothetical protein